MGTNGLKIDSGMVVTLEYTLKDDDGEVLDASGGAEPLVYLHGADNIVAGLENALVGKTVGDKLAVAVTPEDGYGPRDEAGVQEVPRKAFEEGADVEVGALFMTEDDSGNPIPFWITAAGEKTVVVDLNHPLAGETLHFDVEVVGLREALEEELTHGHPHDDGEHDCE